MATVQVTQAGVIVELPRVVSFDGTSIELGYLTETGLQTMTLPRTMFKGQAEWAAKRLRGIVMLPDYGTQERKDWAAQVRQAAAPPAQG